jgi:hypothetical protein
MNRVQQKAIEVLGDHELGIKVDPIGDRVTVRVPVDKQSLGWRNELHEKLDELQDAIAVVAGLHSKIVPIQEPDTDPLRPNITTGLELTFTKGTYIPDSVEKFATRIADAGVKFPGSDGHLTKSKS